MTSGLANVTSRRARPGFTLVELLVVIVIITVVIALTIPAIGRVRRAARVTNSKQMATQVANAAASFQVSERRLPGFYSQHDMGLDENSRSIGMPNMLNAILDMSGGVVKVGGGTPPAGSNAVQVAPFTPAGANLNTIAWVDPMLIGSTSTSNTSSKGYFTPDRKYFYAPRANIQGDLSRFGQTDPSIPDLVDAFGTPILLWEADDAMSGPIAFDNGTSGHNNFARLSSDKDSPKGPAMFYWASNAAHLRATSLGRLRSNQTPQGSSKEYSLVGGGNAEDQIEQSLTGILGNPGFFTGDITKGADTILPSTPRGKFVVHCADPEGYYFECADGGKAIVGSNTIKFGYNFFLADGTTVRKDSNGQPTSEDVTSHFQDILSAGGS